MTKWVKQKANFKYISSYIFNQSRWYPSDFILLTKLSSIYPDCSFRKGDDEDDDLYSSSDENLSSKFLRITGCDKSVQIEFNNDNI